MIFKTFPGSLFFILTAFFFTAAAGAEPLRTLTDAEIRSSIVMVRISTIRYSYREPWMRIPGDTYRAAGLVIPGNRILILANDIRDAGFLEISKHSSYKPARGRILRTDTESNLAVIGAEDEDFFRDLKPLTLGSDPAPGKAQTPWTAVKVDERFQVYRESAGHGDLDVSADYGFTHTPVYSFRTVDSFGSGGFLFQGRSLSAFIQYTDQTRKTRSIPVSVIKAFLERNSSGGSVFPAGGLLIKELTDPVFREYMGVPGNLRGVYISGTLPGTSAYGVLAEKDILLSVDGHDIDERGFYEDPVYGRQSVHLLLIRSTDGNIRKSGDTIPLKIFRDGRVVSLPLKLSEYSGGAEKISWLVPDAPAFLVESGVVFTDLSVPYLRETYGGNWKSRSGEYAYLYDFFRYNKEKDKSRFVVISAVLPHEVNRSFEQFTNSRVLKADGEEIMNTDHLLEILIKKNKAGAPFLKVDLSDGNSLFLDLKQRDSVNAAVAERYSIPYMNHRDRK